MRRTHRCIGQGIDWTLSDGSAFSTIQVVFFEEPFLVMNKKVKAAKVYKDGKVLKNCGASGIPPLPIGACVQQRLMLPDGTWRSPCSRTATTPKGRLCAPSPPDPPLSLDGGPWARSSISPLAPRTGRV